jgi:hypothetical protein
VVLDRVKAAGRVRHEVGHGHLAGSEIRAFENRYIGSDSGRVARHEARAACRSRARARSDSRRNTKTNERHFAVLEKERPDDAAKEAEEDWFPALQE